MKKVSFILTIEFEDAVSASQIPEIAHKAVRGLMSQAQDTEEGLAPEDANTYTNGIFVIHESGVKSEGTISLQGAEVITTDKNGNQEID